jgi:hypothetical protein
MTYEHKITDYLTNQLSDKDRVAFEGQLATDRILKQEVQELQAVWNALQNAESETDTDMDIDFYALLDQEKNVGNPFVMAINIRWKNQFFKAAALVIGLGLAFGIGRLSAPNQLHEIVIREPQKQQKILQTGVTNKVNQDIDNEQIKYKKTNIVEQIVTLQKEVKITQELLILSLLKNTSASDRIKGLSLVSGAQKPDTKLLAELIKIMRQDESLNVRLSAIETLEKFNRESDIRNSFVTQLSQSNEPIEQTILIESLVRMRAKESIMALKDIEKNEKNNQSVRFLAKNSISELELSDNQIIQQP